MTYGENERDLATLVVPRVGELRETGDPWEPYRLHDGEGAVVSPVTAFLKELQAAARPATTQRSYGMDVLRWFRFCWAIRVPWNQATRSEARDFSRWIQISDKTASSGRQAAGEAGLAKPASVAARRPGTVNPVTGKASPGRNYAPATVLHSETVLRGFYEFHLDAGTGPIVNPFPLARAGRRPYAHHNPMQPFRNERTGLYRPRAPKRIPRHIPDEKFNELFALLGSNRDRALVAFWISAGARASELLGALRSGIDPGQQLITVVRKGSRALQRIPASPDAFVWLRLYEEEMRGLVPGRLDDPVWWTLRRPFRPLGYHAARAMFVRANEALGANWSLHDLRHSAAYQFPGPADAHYRAVDPRPRAPDHYADLRVYPEEAISAHRAFITRRRELRPSEEYRTPTDEEWDDFLGHFQRRKLALGDCGRAYGTRCIHEHSCVRGPLLRVDPARRPRLEGIRDNLTARITEAGQQGWTGEIEGLQVSLAAATAKLAQVDGLIARRTSAVDLGMPAYRDLTARTAAIPERWP